MAQKLITGIIWSHATQMATDRVKVCIVKNFIIAFIFTLYFALYCISQCKPINFLWYSAKYAAEQSPWQNFG